ncbi:biopolymer transporter ExbD [Bacteroidia bacterium]|nr:biopolymer transporter ExbD [Bacteroidia bacterium]
MMANGGFSFNKRQKRKPGISSSASADIAFLLLVFFLITSSLDMQTGIYRRMDASAAEDALKQRTNILERNLLELTIDENSQLIYNDSVFDTNNLRELSKTFIANPNHVDFLPEDPSKHVINLKISREANYETYLLVLNELTAAYNELRKASNDTLRTLYPMHISETELADNQTKGGKP